MDVHEVIDHILNETKRTELRGLQIARLLDAHDIPTDTHTVLALLFNMTAIARAIRLPPGLLLVMFAEIADIPTAVVEEAAEPSKTTHLDADTVTVLRHQMANTPRTMH